METAEELWDCYQKGVSEIPCKTIEEQKELFIQIIDRVVKYHTQYDLRFCEKCIQMTNHSQGRCGKCGRVKVKFLGAIPEQIQWGGNDDPNGILEIGKIYVIARSEKHRWHTKIELEGYPGKFFNDRSFEPITK